MIYLIGSRMFSVIPGKRFMQQKSFYYYFNEEKHLFGNSKIRHVSFDLNESIAFFCYFI